MYLKYIEICGFKSFANKTKIELFPGVNIIVGPNGCGKSNIVDAIKWSIGEMSSKSLRMPSMMDVIFAGTTKRQPMNFAEVTLVFDNTERKLNFDFNEVAITRKIYRSEESEYFINRVGCRLKDIREMFLDTGIGYNGYAIIDQGEIEEVLLSNAIERREVFEEVAGISKYKSKRDEAIKKLEKVDVDLSIVENSVAMIEEQIRKLELEAKRAKLQQKYREELKEAEIAYNVKLINSYKQDIEKERQALEPVMKEIESINSDCAQIAADLTNKDLLLNDKINEDRDIAEKISNVKSDVVRTEGNIIKDENLIEEISKQLNDLNINHNKNIENESRFVPLIEEKKKRKAEISGVIGEVKSGYEKEKTDYEVLSQKIAETDAKIKSIESESTVSYQNEISMSNLIVKTESELSHLREDISNLKRDISKNESEAAELNLKSDEIKNSLNKAASEKEALEKELAQTSESRNKNLSNIENIEKEISALSMEKVSLESRLDSMLKDAERDTYWVGTKEVLNANIEGVFGVLRNLIKFSNEDRVLIEDALGETIDAVVVKDRDTAFKCVDFLKSLGKGRARFIILENVPPVNFENQSFSSKVTCDSKFSNLLNFLLSRVSFNETEVLTDLWVVGGVKEVSSNEPYWQETEEIKNRIEEIKRKISELQASKQNEENLLCENDKKLFEIDSKKDEKSLEILNITNSLNNIAEKVSIINENISYLKNNLESVEAREKELVSMIEKYNSEINEIRSKTAVKKDELESVKNERISLEKEIMDKKGKVLSFEHNLSSLNQEAERLDFEIKDMEERLSYIKSEKENYEIRKAEMENRINELKNEISNLKVRYEELNNDRRELEIKRNRVSSEIEEIKNEISRLNMVLKENNDVLKEQVDKRQAIEIKINTLNTKMDDIFAKLRDEYQVNYEDVKDKYNEYEVNVERIEYLKKRIENMGAVNMTAPEEYEALIKEYNDKKTHIDDLKKAKEDLKQAIVKINQTTKENFKNTFDKVNEYFQKIYVTLFEGGEAKLVLTDPDNLLETGVEIVARPPGKKPVNIMQLSGGEKSLAALALLFSFFCVNPSPFCVVDEVDAALDEANVERFVKLIKEFAPTTQFVVITHNKRTMEVGDRIYGVTMEELGVSKIISVDLKRAVDMTAKAEV
ncbi:MAG TPA: chromosome segregation protein SMC [Elusimicrobiales bacterium]|nr:chromosome segregation protein SMC [Elusimicrobiales bacterium]HPO95425.1 chromosome segregation protein SMC [Elusimicrobiales bacterium]